MGNCDLNNFIMQSLTRILISSVFVLPIFEVEEHQQVPRNKSELLDLFHRNLAVWFHFKICPTCHTIPKAKEWLKADDETVMKVFTSVKRQGNQVHWEPLYVGTNAEPLYNERLNWEGKSDKMTQAYIMCLLNYDFKVLSNAFLVHRPGIKSVKEAKRESLEQENLKKILDESLPAIKLFYGERKGCKVFGWSDEIVNPPCYIVYRKWMSTALHVAVFLQFYK